MKKFDFFKALPSMVKRFSALMLVMLMAVTAVFAQYAGTGTFVKINSVDELTSGYYVVTNQTGAYAMKNENSTGSTTYLFSTDAVFTNPSANIVWNVTVADGVVTLYNEAVEKYAAYSGSGNSAFMSATLSDQSRWTVSLDAAGNFMVANVGVNTRYLSYNASSPRFACYGNNNQEELNFYKLQDAEAVTPPTFSVAGGFQYEPVTLTLSAPAGASVYYTLDGSTPTTASTLYTTSINITTNTTVQAIAVVGGEASAVVSATYSFPVTTTTLAFRQDGEANVVYDIPNCIFVYKSGRYVFVKDATGGLCVYDYNTPVLASYQEGDVIPHIYGKRSVYNGLTELVPTHGTDAATDNVGPQAPITLTADDVLNNYSTYEGMLVRLTNVTFTGNRQFVPATRNSVTFSQNGSNNMYIYNAFSTLSANVVTGMHADVVGFLCAYNAQKQLYARDNADIHQYEVALPYTEDFEGVTNQWTFVQDDQVNQWYIGQAVGLQNKGMFISDNGNTNKYNITTESTSHAYLDVMVPAEGAMLSFDYRVGGEGTSAKYDYMAVAVVDNDVAPISNTPMTEYVTELNLSDGWQRAYVQLEGETETTTKRVVLTWLNDVSFGSQPAAAVDNIVITAGSCLPVADLAISDITSSSATISWTNESDVTWQVEYKAADATEWTTLNALGNSVNLANLASNTTYNVRVKTVCSANLNSQYVNTTFTTLSACLAAEDVTVTPAANSAEVTWTVASHSQYDVQYKPASATEWITIITGVTSVPVTIGGLSESTAYNVRVITHCMLDEGTSTSDVVNFTTSEECAAPLFTATVNGNQIEVNWTNTNYFNNYTLQYQLVGSDLWSSEISVSQPPYIISPVETASSYIIRMKTSCNHGTMESNYSTITVDVPCQNGTSPVDLTIGTGTSTSYYSPYNNYYGNSWNESIYLASEIGTAGTINNIAYYVGTATSYSVNQVKVYMGHTTKTQHASSSDWTPLSDLTLVYTGNNLVLGSATGWEYVNFDTPFDYNGNDNLVVVVTHSANSYTSGLKYNYTSSTNRVLYRQADNNTSYAEHPGSNSGTLTYYLPNIMIHMGSCYDQPMCAAPENVTVSNITNTSAQVTWTGNPTSSYVVKVTAPDATMWYNVTGNTYTLTGLTPNRTQYSVVVASQCGENIYSLYSDIVNFETECEALSLPYAQNFDGYNGTTSSTVNILPSCWSKINAGTSYTGYPTTYNSSSYSASGSNSLRFYVYSTTSYQDQYAILPATDANVNELMVNFDMRAYSTSSSTYRSELTVGVMTDPTDASTFTPIQTVTTTNTSYNNYTIYLSNYTGNGSYIALKATKPSAAPAYNVFYVDNLSVDYTPSCVAPTITNYNATAKLLSWEAGQIGTPQGYQVMCASNTAPTVIYNFAVTTEGTLLGLQGLTTYAVYVRTICGEGDTSVWSAPYQIETPADGCLAPSNVVCELDNNSNVVLSWVADPEQNIWAVTYKMSDAPFWSAPVMVTGTPTVTISGLQTAAFYQFRVNAVCNGGASESDYATSSLYIPCSTSTGSPDVEVGTGTSASNYVAFNNYYKNSRNESIYLASELGHGGVITDISFYVQGTGTHATNTLNIYLAHTDKTTFASTSDWTPAADMTLVYSSTGETIGSSSSGWKTFTFDTPFNYNGTDNLVLIVTRTASSYVSSLTHRYTSQSNRVLYRQSDSYAYYADVTNSTAGTRSTYVPNAIFTILPDCDDPILCDAVVNTVSLDNVGSNDVTVSWTATNAVSYVVEYGPQGFSSGAGTQITTTGTSMTINNMEPSTAYDIVIYPVCANDNTGTPARVTANTACGLITVTETNPWLETFDVNYSGSGAVSLGECWATPITSSQSNGTFPAVYTGYSAATYSGDNSLEMKGANQMVVLPEFSNDINTLQFDFWANTTASSSNASQAGTMEVGVVTDVNNENTFLALYTVPPTAFNRTGTDAAHADHVGPFSFANVTLDVNPRIAIRITNANNSNSWNLDNFNVSLIGGSSDEIIMGETSAVTTCDVTIYDNGGADGAYLNNSDETLVITPATPGAALHLTGTYSMESNWDFIYIYDSENNLVATLTGSGTADYTVNGAITLNLTSDGSYTDAGFAFHVECVDPVEQPDAYVMGETASVTSCNAIIYDNGGQSGDYINSSDVDMVLNPATPGAQLHIYGTYNMEEDYDFIYVYDAQGTQVLELTGEGNLDITMSAPVTINLSSDYSVTYSGFAFHVECIIPENISTAITWAGGLSDACDLSNQYIVATFNNNGLDAVTTMIGSYSVNGGAPVTETFSLPAVAPGETGAVTFSTPVVFDQTTNTVEVTLYAADEPAAMRDDNTFTITGIDEVAPMTAPYTVLPAATSTIGVDGWKTVDGNNSGLAWTISNSTMNAPYSDVYDNNSWLITPCYDLPAGTYVVKYDYKVGDAAIPEKFAVCYGEGGNVADMTNLLAQHQNITNSSYVTAQHVITIPADGVYNFGFLANSERGGLGVSVKNLKVEQLVQLTAYANGNGSITPSGTFYVGANTTQTFVMNPEPHAYLQSVTVNGQVVATYNNISNGVAYVHTVTTDHDVVIANFTATNMFTYNINGGQGYVNGGFYTAPATFSEEYAYNQDQYITFEAAEGYHVENVNINGVDYGPITYWVITHIAQNYNFVITFAPNTYVVTTTAYGNGYVSDGATFVYNPNNTYTFSATPGNNSHIASILRNNEELTVADPFATYSETLTNILSDYDYVVRFDPNTYSVTATAGAHGTITPNGVSYYNYNTNANYYIEAANGYYITSVTIDGVTTDYTQGSALTSMSYTFPNISANHTISAVFAQYEYTITVNAGAHGTITPGTTTVAENATPTFNITPNAGYGIASVTVDGVSVGAVASYTFAPVTANHTIEATFAQYQYTITANAGNGGSITPNGVTNMVYNGTQTYTITPATGYHINNVYVDGASVGAVSSYTFTDVTANHTIFATFDINEYTITVNQPNNGVINPGTTTVQYGATPTFVVTPNTGYYVSAITLNGTNVINNATQVNGVYTYTLPAVTADRTLTATMTQKTFTITASAGAHGTINPSGTATVNFGANKSYNFNPATGYEVENVTVDGMNMGAITSYTFVNVVANHTINVTFKLQECELPTNLQTIFIDSTSATLSWYHAGASSYDIQYKAINEATFTSTTTTQLSYMLTGLTPSTTYIWMVRANCVANNPSPWTNGCIFRTLDVPTFNDGIEDHVQEMINVCSVVNNVYIINENGIRIDNVQIYDVYGKLIYAGTANSSSEVISMNVATGTYIVHLNTEYGVATYKLHLTK